MRGMVPVMLVHRVHGASVCRRWHDILACHQYACESAGQHGVPNETARFPHVLMFQCEIPLRRVARRFSSKANAIDNCPEGANLRSL
jgi:hypothetical protein